MSSIITDIKTKLNSAWQSMPTSADVRWAGQRTVALIDNHFFGFSHYSQMFANGRQTAWRAFQEQQYQEFFYGSSRVVRGGIGLYNATTDIAERVSQTVAASPTLQACHSIVGIVSHIISWCDGMVASMRLSWMIQATDAEIEGLSEAQLQRRLGEEFPLADIQEFKRTGSQDILLRMRQQAKRNLYFRSFQVAMASLSITTFYTGAPIYARAAGALGKILFAQSLYERRYEHLNTALAILEKIPPGVKSAAQTVFINAPKKVIANIDWFFEFSDAFHAANEARKRGDWQEMAHGSLRIITNALFMAKIPGVILSNLNSFLNLLDKTASSGLLSYLSVVGIVLSVYSFFEGLVSSIRLAWMIRATDKQIEGFSAHQLNKRLGPSYKNDIQLFNKISQIPEEKRTDFDRMTLDKLLPDMRAQAKRKLVIRALQVTVAALSIAAIICTLAACPVAALVLSILAIGFMVTQLVLDGAWAENRGTFSLLNFLPITEQKDFEAMTKEELIKCLGEGFTDKIDRFKECVKQKNEIALMNLVPEMQEQAKRKQMMKILFIASVVGAIAGVVAVAVSAFPIAIALAVAAAILLALHLILDHAWAEKQGKFSPMSLLPSSLEQKIVPLFNAKQLREEEALKEQYPWLQEVLQSMNSSVQ